MAIHKNVLLFLCITACIKLSSQMQLSFYEDTCTEDTRRDHIQRHMCISSYGCGYHRAIISKIINCSNISIDALKLYEEAKENFPSYGYSLTLKVINSEIPELPTSTFKNLKNLTILFMENVKLKTIMPAAFNYLDQLKEIYLGQNELTTISDGIFNSLVMLEKLDLSHNRIETITNHAFIGCTLKNLNLKYNNISCLGEVLLNSLSHLAVLDLSYNNLSNISGFHDLPLQRLNLSHNNIDTVDFEMFRQTSIFIDFSFNNISEMKNFNVSQANRTILSHNKISNFERNDYVTVLDIGYNDLQVIQSALLSKHLTELYVSFNFILSLKADTFFGLDNLEILFLDNNNFSSVPNSCFKDLRSLISLNLSGNRLTDFKFGTFDNLVNLEMLDISNNYFKELPQFHSLAKLTHLYLQNNEINKINANDVLLYMRGLTDINLNNNTWSCQTLVKIIHIFRRNKISISNGNFWEGSNIYGVKCYETDTNSDLNISKSNEINLDVSKIKTFFNEDFTKTLLYKYFNQDFKESEFFKYLEDLKRSTNSTYAQNIDYNALNKLLREINANVVKDNFKNSEMYNYFNKDFKNTSFFKYLENLRLNTNKSETLDDEGKLEEIASSFQNILKELEKISNTNKSNEYFGKTEMYNYFNKDFKTSNFFKYLESLNGKYVSQIHAEDVNDSTNEKLIGPYENITNLPNYTGLLSVIAISLLIMICIMVTIAYRQFFHVNKYTSKKEEVELICNNEI